MEREEKIPHPKRVDNCPLQKESKLPMLKNSGKCHWLAASRKSDGMVEHKPGKKKDKKVMLYALSTCMWCKKTKKLLDDHDVDYNYIFVDLIEGEERDAILKEVEKHNPAVSFPTILVDGACIIGFDENKIKDALALDKVAKK